MQKNDLIKKKDQMTMVRKMYEMILSRDINNKYRLESNWTRGTPSHTQPKRIDHLLLMTISMQKL